MTSTAGAMRPASLRRACRSDLDHAPPGSSRNCCVSRQNSRWSAASPCIESVYDSFQLRSAPGSASLYSRTRRNPQIRGQSLLKGLLTFSLTRRPLVLLGLLAFVGAGIFAFFRLNIEAYPNPAPVI